MISLSKKYARAYLNMFGSSLNLELADRFSHAATFLYNHRRALFLLKVPVIPAAVKRAGLVSFIQRFNIPQEAVVLIDLLLRDRRAYLLADIFQELARSIRDSLRIVDCLVTSSVELNADQRSQIERFISDQVGATVHYDYTVDKQLIAGIRIQSDTFLWEQSIEKQLRHIYLSCMQ